MQDAGVRPALGHDHLGAVRDLRPGPPPLPLRRAGQLARPDRGAAGEQRPADHPGDAGRHPVQGRTGPRRPAPGLERGAGPAPALGPAVEPAHPAGAGLRIGPAGVRRPVQWLSRGRGQDRGTGGRRGGGDRHDPADGRDGAGGGVGVRQGPASRRARGPASTHRVRPRPGGGGQLLPGHRAEPAHRGHGRGGPPRRPGLRGGGARGPGGLVPATRPGRGAGRPRPPQGRRGASRCQPDGGDAGLRPGRRHYRRVVTRAARGVRRVPGPHRRAARRRCPRVVR